MFRIYLLLVNIFLVAKGFSGAKCCEEKILICGVIKNGAKGFPTVKKYAEEVGSKFLDYRVIVYENNSTDNTKELYSSWAQENPKGIFISEDLTQEFIENFTPKQGDYRTEFIARARNIVLDRAFHVEFDDFEYLMMVDLDGFKSWPTEEIISTIEHPQNEWDGVCANGSYDLYALRNSEFILSVDLINETWFSSLQYIGIRLKKILSTGLWYKVESAFGGLAIYKRESIRNSRYKGLMSKNYVQKTCLRNFADDLIFKRFKKRNIRDLDFKLQEIQSWMESGFLFDLSPKYPYICEHVNFHYQMSSQGFDRIYINPKLKMISLEHPNY